MHRLFQTRNDRVNPIAGISLRVPREMNDIDGEVTRIFDLHQVIDGETANRTARLFQRSKGTGKITGSSELALWLSATS